MPPYLVTGRSLGCSTGRSGATVRPVVTLGLEAPFSVTLGTGMVTDRSGRLSDHVRQETNLRWVKVCTTPQPVATLPAASITVTQ
jgi:hypothetical protein